MILKKNKGFTLIELLAVIVILGALIAIAVPSVIYVSNNLKTKMYCTKLDTVEEAAKLYGQDNQKTLINSCTVKETTYNNCLEVSIDTLLTENYVKSDNTNNEVLDPRNKESINAKTVYIYEKNNRVYATIIDPECN